MLCFHGGNWKHNMQQLTMKAFQTDFSGSLHRFKHPFFLVGTRKCRVES